MYKQDTTNWIIFFLLTSLLHDNTEWMPAKIGYAILNIWCAINLLIILIRSAIGLYRARRTVS
jgi:hypothetical protein